MIFVVTAFYKLANTLDRDRKSREGYKKPEDDGENSEDEDPVKYLPLDFIKDEQDDFLTKFIPNFPLEKVMFEFLLEIDLF